MENNAEFSSVRTISRAVDTPIVLARPKFPWPQKIVVPLPRELSSTGFFTDYVASERKSEQLEGLLLQRGGAGHDVERCNRLERRLDAVFDNRCQVPEQVAETLHRQIIGVALTTGFGLS